MRKSHTLEGKWGAFAFDNVLVFVALSLACCGVLCVYSAGAGNAHKGDYLAFRQLGWIFAGCVVFLVASVIGYHRLFSLAYPLYAGALVLLLLTVFFAPKIKGAQSWLALGGVRFQPSEITKTFFILALAKFLGRYPPLSLKPALAGVTVVLPAIVLLLAQPDAGSAMVYLVITMGMLFVAGMPLRYFSVLGSGVLICAPFFWFFLKGYQKLRLLVFLDPMRDPLGAGYNVIQSRIAVGSGGFWGKGFMMGMQSKLRFLPEPHTDFIFSVFAEEFGFLGTTFILSLFALVFFRLLVSGVKSRDQRCKLFVAGVAAWLWVQMFESIAMSMGLMPVTGLPLPFLSYGGSSLLAVSAALGLVNSIYAENTRRLYRSL